MLKVTNKENKSGITIKQNQGNYQAPQMTETQVIDDAQQSGGSVNQFEAQNINAYTPPPQAPFAVNYDDVYGADI